MKKVIRLTESQLTDLIEKVIKNSKTINEKWKGDVTSGVGNGAKISSNVGVSFGFLPV